MSELAYCPYCKKQVPYTKASRGGRLAFGIISIYFIVPFILGFILLGYPILSGVSIVVFCIFEVLYWRSYRRHKKYKCNICKSEVYNIGDEKNIHD